MAQDMVYELVRAYNLIKLSEIVDGMSKTHLELHFIEDELTQEELNSINAIKDKIKAISELESQIKEEQAKLRVDTDLFALQTQNAQHIINFFASEKDDREDTGEIIVYKDYILKTQRTKQAVKDIKEQDKLQEILQKRPELIATKYSLNKKACYDLIKSNNNDIEGLELEPEKATVKLEIIKNNT